MVAFGLQAFAHYLLSTHRDRSEGGFGRSRLSWKSKFLDTGRRTAHVQRAGSARQSFCLRGRLGEVFRTTCASRCPPFPHLRAGTRGAGSLCLAFAPTSGAGKRHDTLKDDVFPPRGRAAISTYFVRQCANREMLLGLPQHPQWRPAVHLELKSGDHLRKASENYLRITEFGNSPQGRRLLL